MRLPRPHPIQRRVFLDATFLDALVDPAHPDRAQAVETFEVLVGEYEEGTTMLATHDAAVTATVDPDRARQAARVCEVERIGGDVRREARRVQSEHPELELSVTQAITLVVLRRSGIGEVAAFDNLFDRLDITVVGGA